MANNIPEELKYTKDHEWTKLVGDVAVIGITDFAQSSLGDIVFVELPDIGKQLNTHQSFGVVESIKSVSDLFSPIAGTVVEVNQKLINSPELCNTEPYGSAWMIKVKLTNTNEVNSLMSPSDYQNFLSSL